MKSPLHTTDTIPDTAQQQAASQQAANATTASAHLANERTFVSWCGVGVLLIVTGVISARVSHTLNTSPFVAIGMELVKPRITSTLIGLSFVASGAVLIILACYRFLRVQKDIEQGCYRASSFLALAFLCLMLFLSALLALNLLEVDSYF